MSKKLPKATVATLEEIRHHAMVEPPSAQPTSAPTSTNPAPATDMAIALRRSRAREVVERYTTYAAVGGLIPLPFLDSLSVMATIALMIQAVAAIYGM
ncbi:MAG TPA: DUF697 domain-containing protein, partial [Telmatospirillum sp.]|nr:DUF697 domain-containing protein [Telmatospirillum sp.]